jgi:hypothetical protein
MVLPTENYQVLIPGSGEARTILGVDTGRLRKMYGGGSCPNIACLSNKNAVHSAKVVSEVPHRSCQRPHPGILATWRRSGEVMGVVQLAMIVGAPYTSTRDAIVIHPTMVEGLNVRFSKSVERGNLNL